MSDTPKTITLTPEFQCEYELYDLETFQSGGHFVTGLRDDNGFRRQWEGSEVHVLTLKHQGEQVLRMMADSLEAVSKLMTSELRQMFTANWLAQFLQGFSHDAFVKQRDRLAELQAFIDEQYAPEIKRGQHGAFQDSIAVAMYYMGKERESRGVFDLKTGESINLATGRPYPKRAAKHPVNRKAAKR